MNDSSNNIEELLQMGYRYALSLTHKHHDAEDLIQEAYMTLIRHYGIISNRKIFLQQYGIRSMINAVEQKSLRLNHWNLFRSRLCRL